MRCDRCGLESPIATAFKRTKTSFRKGHQVLCIACRRERLNGARAIGIAVSLDALGIAICVWLEDAKNGRPFPQELALPVNFSISYLLGFLCIIPHELGHALAGWLTGCAIWRVRLGRGRILKTWRFRGTQIEWRLMPDSGSVQATTANSHAWRWKRLALYLSGPMANLALLIGGAIVLILRAAPWADWPNTAVNIPADLCLANALQLWSNLVPKKPNGLTRQHANDGKLAVDLLRDRVAVTNATSHRQHLLQCALRLSNDGDHARAVQMVSQLLSERGSDLSLRSNMAMILSAAGQWVRAREILLGMLSEHPKEDEFRANLWNTLAWDDLNSHDPALRAEADRFSVEAFSIAPWLPEILSTRGRYLVEAGETEAGIEMLRKSLREAYEPKNRALVLGSLAYGRFNQGDRNEALRLLKKARKIDPACELLPVTDQRICNHESMASTQ